MVTPGGDRPPPPLRHHCRKAPYSQGNNIVTSVRVEPRLCENGDRKNNSFALSVIGIENV